jgi:hypothetical protein
MALDILSGRAINELLAEYAQPITTIKSNLALDLVPADDVMVLRYLIQERDNVEDAEKRAREGHELRQKYASVLEKALKGEQLEQEARIRNHLCYGRWQYPSAESESEQPPMIITRSGKSNGQALMGAVTENELVEYFLWERQRCFDEVCKRGEATGQLVMMVGVNDLEGASLLTGREPKFFKAVKTSSEAGAAMFPLLTRKHVMVNGGRLMEILFSVASTFMPQRVLDKVAFMTCEQLVDAAGIPPADLPEFLGGKCPIPDNSPLLGGASAA